MYDIFTAQSSSIPDIHCTDHLQSASYSKYTSVVNPDASTGIEYDLFLPKVQLIPNFNPFDRNFSQSCELARWVFINDSQEDHPYRQNPPKHVLGVCAPYVNPQR